MPCGFREEDFFMFFSHCKSMEANDPRGGAITPGAWLAGFVKRSTRHCYIQNTQNMKLKLCALWSQRRRFFLRFSHCKSVEANDPRGGAITQGAWLAGFVKRSTRHCYIQNTPNMKLKLCALWSQRRRFFLRFSHCKSVEANDPRGGAIFDPRGMVGRICKEEYYTMLQTKYESSAPCGLREEDLFYVVPLEVYGSYLLPWKSEF